MADESDLAEEQAVTAELEKQLALKAQLASAIANEKAALAASANEQRAGIAAAAAEQKAAIASRLQQERAVQQAILAAQANASEASSAYDKRAHEVKLALIKQETTQQLAASKQIAAAQQAAAKQTAKAPALALGGAEKDVGASFLSGIFPSAEKLGTSAGMASAAGGVVAAGASALMSAAIKLGESAAGLVKAGAELSIAETSKKEVQSAVMKKLGGNFEATVDLALKLGMDTDDAITQTKKLLNAKFKQKEIPLLLRIKAGMDLAGLDGDSLLKKLETIKLEPKVKTKDIDGLSKIGVNSKKVYQELAKTLHTDVAGAMAKVKSGSVDAATAVAAIEKVAGKKFGPLADVLGGSIPALLMRLKGNFARLFDSVDLGPMKDALKNMNDALAGPEGKAMKTAATEAGGAIFKGLFGAFSGPEGRNRMTSFAASFVQAMHAITMAATVAGAALKALINTAASGKKTTVGAELKKGESQGRAAAGGVDFGAQVGGMIGKAQAKSKMDDLTGLLGNGLDLGAVNDNMGGQGASIGKGITDGVVAGVEGGSPEAVGAAIAMAERMLAAIKARLGQHSPSTEFAEVGHYSAEGMAQGMGANSNPASAAADMGKKALGAASAASGGGAGGGGGKGASSGGGGISITIQIGAGATAAQGAAVKAEIDKGLPGWLAMQRAAGRQAQEAAA